MVHPRHSSFDGPSTRARTLTSVCLTLKLGDDQVKKVVKLLEAEGVAYDAANTNVLGRFISIQLTRAW